MHSIVENIKTKSSGLNLRPPVSQEALALAEDRIGFRLPSLLRELYANIADGGFGPSYGFLPLLAAVQEQKIGNVDTPRIDSVVELYELFKKGDPEDTSWVWPDRLLPVLEWGCAVRSCIDCSSSPLAVVRDEPYVSRLEEAPSLEQWLQSWLDGHDLWNMNTRRS